MFMLQKLEAITSAASVKGPPVLAVEDNHLNWKNDTEMFELFTDSKAEKHSPPIYLTLIGHARDAMQELNQNMPMQLSANSLCVTIHRFHWRRNLYVRRPVESPHRVRSS